MVAVLLEAGRGNMDASQVRRLIEARDPSRGPVAAAAHGLYLIRVTYPTTAFDEPPTDSATDSATDSVLPPPPPPPLGGQPSARSGTEINEEHASQHGSSHQSVSEYSMSAV